MTAACEGGGLTACPAADSPLRSELLLPGTSEQRARLAEELGQA